LAGIHGKELGAGLKTAGMTSEKMGIVTCGALLNDQKDLGGAGFQLET
jgi:hypothetical protein